MSTALSRRRELEAIFRLLSAAGLCADDVGAHDLAKMIEKAAALAEKEMILSNRPHHA